MYKFTVWRYGGGSLSFLNNPFGPGNVCIGKYEEDFFNTMRSFDRTIYKIEKVNVNA
jgi:hypothetical protein